MWVCVMAAYGPFSMITALCPTRSWPSSAGLRPLKTGNAHATEHKCGCFVLHCCGFPLYTAAASLESPNLIPLGCAPRLHHGQVAAGDLAYMPYIQSITMKLMRASVVSEQC